MPNNYSPIGGGGFCMDMPGGPGAPEIKGTWISKKTGAEVQVRDCIIAENGMSVMLSDGRMIDMDEFSTEFYQISDDIYDSNGNIIGKADGNHPVPVPPYNPCPDECQPPHHHHPLPPPPPDCGCHDKPMPPCPPHHHPLPPPPLDCGCHHHPMPPCPPHHHPMPPCPPHHHPECQVDIEKKHMNMVTDVFSKVNPVPKIICGSTLVMENAPLDQLQMLIDIFGVHIEDIAIYLYQNYYTPEKVISYLKKVLTETYKLKEPVIQEPTNPDTDGTTDTTIDPDFGI